VNKQLKDMDVTAHELQTEIDEYGNISVPYRNQRQQTEKQAAYNKRLSELVNKYKSETSEVRLKMQQNLDLVKRQQTLRFQNSTSSLYHDEEGGHLMQAQQLDVEELKV